MSYVDSDEPKNNLGKASSIAGISSLFFGFMPYVGVVSLVLSPFAIIAGLIALRRKPRLFAIIGIVSGMVLPLLAIVATVELGNAIESSLENATTEGTNP
ncbi:hypothetical protein [Altererythrobacter sp. Z27]|uniref:hypothetical protein n=1 Tax=Altererythrobacter sp. Z27 TaxID=3461147 RepID=UPI004043A6ED